MKLSNANWDVTPVIHPAVARDRPVLSRMSAGEATGGFTHPLLLGFGGERRRLVPQRTAERSITPCIPAKA